MASASTIANNQDLLTQILIHLPIKSLVRFKSVSKHWLSIISDPQLFRCHRHPVPAAPSALFLHLPSVLGNPEFVLLPLNTAYYYRFSIQVTQFRPDPSGIRILQSCNGLLFCCSEERSRSYYVYNPTTKLLATLPKPDGLFISTVLGIVLSFDPSASHDNYKAIRVRFYGKSTRFQNCYVIDVFLSETRSWRLSASEPFEENFVINFINKGVFCNGVVYWRSGFTDTFLGFDLKYERVLKVPCPENSINFATIYFGESMGILYLLRAVQREDFSTDYNVYQVERDFSGWVMKYRVDLDEMASAYPEMIDHRLNSVASNYLFSVFCIVVKENDDEKESFIVLHIPGKTVRYNLNDKSFHVLREFDVDCFYHQQGFLTFEATDAYQFIESRMCLIKEDSSKKKKKKKKEEEEEELQNRSF